MIRKHYACVSCTALLEYDHHPSIEADPLPAGIACPRCGFTVGADPRPGVVAPHLVRPIKGVVDDMARGMEESSRHRADLAREHFGLDADAAAAMVETNMRDHLREGDTSNVPVDNPVSRQIAAAPQNYGFQPSQGIAASPAVQAGYMPNAGLRALEGVRSFHGSFTQGAGHAGATTSSVPDIRPENYRRRI